MLFDYSLAGLVSLGLLIYLTYGRSHSKLAAGRS